MADATLPQRIEKLVEETERTRAAQFAGPLHQVAANETLEQRLAWLQQDRERQNARIGQLEKRLAELAKITQALV